MCAFVSCPCMRAYVCLCVVEGWIGVSVRVRACEGRAIAPRVPTSLLADEGVCMLGDVSQMASNRGLPPA